MTTPVQLPPAPVSEVATERLRSKHLLGIAGLDAGEISLILDTAVAMGKLI